MIIIPSSQLQRHMGKIVNQAKTSKQPIYMTKNGKGYFVLLDIETFEEKFNNYMDRFFNQNAMEQFAELERLREQGKLKYISADKAHASLNKVLKKKGMPEYDWNKKI